MGKLRSQSCVLRALLALGVSTSAVATPNPVVVWNKAALEEVRRGRLGPPVVARALAVAHTCIFDAWVPYDGVAMAHTLALPRRPQSERTEPNKSKAIGFAAYRCLLNLFPAGAARLEAVMRSQGHDPLDFSTQASTPQGIGNTVAAAVIASRLNDGSNQAGNLRPNAYSDYTLYAPSNAPMPFCLPQIPGPCAINVANPYKWQPLINNLGVTQSFIAPHWGLVRPFALSSANQFDNHPMLINGPNYLRSPAHYQADINDILAYSRNLTERQKLIVEYWADGPESELPPGHWSLFAQHVARRDGHSIDQAVKMFFAMQNASFDAGILAWYLKRKYEGVRPITSIRHFRQGQSLLAWGGPGRPIEVIDGGKWTPYNPGSNLTPAFPGYVSGHSTFSAASATVLRASTGSDHFGFSTVIAPNFGRVEPGVPLVPTTVSYSTFTAAVDEAGLSRLYAGIHFADDNTVGQWLGNQAGQLAWTKSKLHFDGGLPSAVLPLAMNVSCNNLSLGAQTYANVEVPAGSRCLLTGTRLNGNLILGSGASADLRNVVITGNLQGTNAGTVQLSGGSISGSVQLSGSQAVTLVNTSLTGSVQISFSMGPIWLENVRPNGNIQLFDNRNTVQLYGNVAGGNLQCQNNTQSPTGSSNHAISKQGQCFNL